MKTIPIALCLGLLGSTASWSQTSSGASVVSAADLQMMIDKLKKETEEEEKAWAEEKSKETEANRKRKERYEAFSKERQEVQNSIGETEKQIAERVAQMDRLKVRDANLQAQFVFLRGVVLEQARQLEEKMRGGFPFRTEKRLESIQLLVDDLIKERISPEEGFNRLWVIYQTEENLASDAEIYSGTMVLDNNETVAVKYMRVGKQILAYASPAGDKLGILVPEGKERWNWMRENQMDYGMRQIVKNAIATAEGKAVPGFVEFPLWLRSFSVVAEAK